MPDTSDPSTSEPGDLDQAVVDAQTRPHDGGTTVTEVLAGYAAGGFTGSFTAVAGGKVQCHACDATTPGDQVRMSSLRRMEGASDPGDMMAIVAIECPACDTKGTLVLGFGPMASEEDSDLLHVLRDARSDDHAPGNSAPGEASGDAPDEQSSGR
jgi:hypothetical protein